MSDADAVLAVDLGTSSVKVGIYRLDGSLVEEGTRPIRLRRLGDGRVEQDLDEFYEAFVGAGRGVLARARFAPQRIGAIAIAGQMAGVGLVDRFHRPLAPYDSWLDARCGDIVEELTTNFGPRIAATSGCAPTLSIGPKMLWWARHRRAVVDEAVSFVTAAGYVTGAITGLAGDQAFIDPSHLHFASFADVGSAQWDHDLVDEVGLPSQALPSVVESTTVVGELTHASAQELGLVAGTPVAAGCGDTAAAALGAGVFEPGEAFDVAGTAAVFGACTPTFTPDTAGTLMTMRSALPGRWYALAYVGDAGQVIEWACRELLGPAVGEEHAYEVLARSAMQVEAGSDGVLVFPHFSGRIAPVAPTTRGAVIGISPFHGSAHMARAVLEAIAFEYRGYAQRLAQLAPGHGFSTVTGTGGGSRSAVWNQIKADVLGVPYRPIAGGESGLRGAATVAMVALGHPVPELDQRAYGQVAHPEAARRSTYQRGYERYRWWAEHLVAGYRHRFPTDTR